MAERLRDGNSLPVNGIEAQIEETMKLRSIVAALLFLAMSFPAFGQNDNSGVKQDTKDAAHASGRAAKKTGKKVKRGTKKVVHKGAHKTRKGAAKVEGATTPSPTPPPL
jgi:predicted small secreted protein